TVSLILTQRGGAGPYPCPDCGTPAARYDSKPRRWRHLDTMQFTTWIEADVPRVECGTHGVKQVRVPWAKPRQQFSALFAGRAMDLLRECSIRGAVRLLRITWDEGWGIQDVARHEEAREFGPASDQPSGAGRGGLRLASATRRW